MKLNKCPICRANLHLDQLAQDECSTELLAKFAKMPVDFAASVISYLTLFRPETSALSNSRALKLVNDVLALTDNKVILQAALEQSVALLTTSRAQGDTRTLKNHNYLKRVVEAMASQAVIQPAAPSQSTPSQSTPSQPKVNPAPIPSTSKMAQAIEQLKGMKR